MITIKCFPAETKEKDELHRGYLFDNISSHLVPEWLQDSPGGCVVCMSLLSWTGDLQLSDDDDMMN